MSEKLTVLVPGMRTHRDDPDYREAVEKNAHEAIDRACQHRRLQPVADCTLVWSGTWSQARAKQEAAFDVLRQPGLDPYGGNVDGLDIYLFEATATDPALIAS